jgi:SAM-dependent methyltransferase
MPTHREQILDQFSRQAVPFSQAAPMRDASILELLADTSAVGPEDTVLDVACGPGLVACAFAARARHVTGLDLTPAMLERAHAHAEASGLRNVSWRCADVLPLPFADASFTRVISRLAFHHFAEPGRVLAEMKRVCAPGGRVMVADLYASEDPTKADCFHRMEMLRDPSHLRALPLSQLRGLFAEAGLTPDREAHYDIDNELDSWLARSFPAPGSEPEIRRMFEVAMADDGFGLRLRRQDEKTWFTFPVVVLCAEVSSG